MAPTKRQFPDDLVPGGMDVRQLTEDAPEGLGLPVIIEWKLMAQSVTHGHLRDGHSYVVEGQLSVESGGVTIEAGPGDLVHVPQGEVARYWAGQYTRVLGIYAAGPGLPPMSDAVFAWLPTVREEREMEQGTEREPTKGPGAD
jgi:ethanolamine utilization protein EutQ (cupin superfamily)